MEKFFVGFEKRLEGTEKVAMGAQLVRGFQSFAKRFGGLFRGSAPRAGGPVLRARSVSSKPYPGVDAHKLGPIKTKVITPKMRTPPKPVKGFDYSSGTPRPIQ